MSLTSFCIMAAWTFLRFPGVFLGFPKTVQDISRDFKSVPGVFQVASGCFRGVRWSFRGTRGVPGGLRGFHGRFRGFQEHFRSVLGNLSGFHGRWGFSVSETSYGFPRCFRGVLGLFLLPQRVWGAFQLVSRSFRGVPWCLRDVPNGNHGRSRVVNVGFRHFQRRTWECIPDIISNLKIARNIFENIQKLLKFLLILLE